MCRPHAFLRLQILRSQISLLNANSPNLATFLEVNINDRCPRFVQASKDVAVDNVKRQRKCVFTNLNHARLKSSDVNTHAPA
jgi:hypothetical protein